MVACGSRTSVCNQPKQHHSQSATRLALVNLAITPSGQGIKAFSRCTIAYS